jgi:diguanylate cyclase (GGDEF)-like protein
MTPVHRLRLVALLIAITLPAAVAAQQPPPGRMPPPGGMGGPPGATGHQLPPPPPPGYAPEQLPPQQQQQPQQAAQGTDSPGASANAAPAVASTPAAAPARPEEVLPKPVQPFDELQKNPPPPPLEFGRGAGERDARPAPPAPLASGRSAILPAMPQSLPRWLWLLAAAAVLSFLGWRASVRRSGELEREAERLAREQRQLKSAHGQLKSQSEQLRQMATNDPLTGVLNRQGFAGELRTSLEHLARFHRPLNLMLIDMDNFKQINDRLGHLVGDQSLKLVVGVAREHLDSEHLFGRFGGDEFMIACADEPLEASAALAEAIRVAVVRAAAEHEPPLAGLSLSIGIAQANEVTGYRSETLFHRADTALYAAKHGGRNRVVLSDESLPPPPVLEAATRHLV